MLQKTEQREVLFYMVLMGICGLNSGLNFIFIAIMILQMRNGYVGFLKACLWLTLKQGLLLPPFTSQLTTMQINIKLLVMALGAVWVLASYFRQQGGNIPRYCAWVLLFGISALVSAMIFGSYPVAGSVKVMSFTLVLMAIVIAASECNEYFELETYLYYVLSGVMIVSFCTLPYGGAYMQGSAGALFRGIWNHPNDFGVICAIYLSIVLVRCTRIGYIQGIQLIMVFVMIFFSNSRGAMIASLGIIAMYFFLCEERSDKIIIGIAFIAVMMALLYTSFGDVIERFFIKGSEKLSVESFSSRGEIKEVAMTRFRSNRLFGRGLLISYEPGITSFIFNEDGTEPGNIFYELLAGTGIIGMICFVRMAISFFSNAMKKNRLYVLTAVLASISEVSFFSVNNYACLYYILLAMCIVPLNKFDYMDRITDE